MARGGDMGGLPSGPSGENAGEKGLLGDLTPGNGLLGDRRGAGAGDGVASGVPPAAEARVRCGRGVWGGGNPPRAAEPAVRAAGRCAAAVLGGSVVAPFPSMPRRSALSSDSTRASYSCLDLAIETDNAAAVRSACRRKSCLSFLIFESKSPRNSRTRWRRRRFSMSLTWDSRRTDCVTRCTVSSTPCCRVKIASLPLRSSARVLGDAGAARGRFHRAGLAVPRRSLPLRARASLRLRSSPLLPPLSSSSFQALGLATEDSRLSGIRCASRRGWAGAWLAAICARGAVLGAVLGTSRRSPGPPDRCGAGCVDAKMRSSRSVGRVRRETSQGRVRVAGVKGFRAQCNALVSSNIDISASLS